MSTATAKTALSTAIVAAVPIKVSSSLISKWLGQTGKSQALLLCCRDQTLRLRPAVPTIARHKQRDRPARASVGVRRREAMMRVV